MTRTRYTPADKRLNPAVALWLIIVFPWLAACTPAPDASASAQQDPIFAQTIADARAGGASDRQIEVLEEAQAKGELTYSMFHDVLDDFFACLTDLGIQYEREDYEPTPGFIVPTGSFFDSPALGPEQTLILADACFLEHSQFANILYYGQPIVLEIADTAINEHRPQVIACLAEHGVSASAAATPDELRQLAFELDATYLDRDEAPPLCTDRLD